MGYRELLKKYILHLQVTAGDHFIETASAESVLSSRDLGELKTLAAEIHRGAYNPADRACSKNCNARVRVLMNQHGLTAQTLAALCELDVDTVSRWRTSPKSARYLTITETEFARVQKILFDWLESPSR